MNFTVLIPARLASTRLPNKPLADIGGAPMVVRVAQRALKSRAGRVVVAADSAEIIEKCDVVTLKVQCDVTKLMQQHEPKIIDAVMSKGHSNSRTAVPAP